MTKYYSFGKFAEVEVVDGKTFRVINMVLGVEVATYNNWKAARATAIEIRNHYNAQENKYWR